MSEDLPAEAHYFRTPSGPGTRRDIGVVLAGQEFTLHTAPGVFSIDRIDLGTRVLLRDIPAPPATGDLLDLGCGWGPIAITQALLAPDATVWAADVNERCLELTAENAVIAGCANVRAVLPPDIPDDVRFASIWSNPPIRIGKAALHELLLTWLPRLLPGAQAHLVVQRNLGADSLHAWLKANLPVSEAPEASQASGTLDQGWRVERAGSAKGYRVLRVTAPG